MEEGRQEGGWRRLKDEGGWVVQPPAASGIPAEFQLAALSHYVSISSNRQPGRLSCGLLTPRHHSGCGLFLARRSTPYQPKIKSCSHRSLFEPLALRRSLRCGVSHSLRVRHNSRCLAFCRFRYDVQMIHTCVFATLWLLL